jgi:hypothetical protein
VEPELVDNQIRSKLTGDIKSGKPANHKNNARPTDPNWRSWMRPSFLLFG